MYESIYELVRRIPKGKVATYGQVAQLCGLREHARLVGYALHNLKPNSACGTEPSADVSGVPWHRVINSKGMISLPKHTGAYQRQKTLLEMEGVKFEGEKVDLIKSGYTNIAKQKK